MDKLKENKLIAEFMGWRKHEGFSYITPHYKDYISVANEIHQSRVFHFDSLKFHSSWDWLMPVVEKIGNLPSIGDAPHPTEFRMGMYSNIIAKVSSLRGIDAVYLAVVEFIKWYNKNK